MSRLDDPNAFSHRPVMLDEIVELFGAVPPGTIVDGTVGGGGHAAAILEAHPQLEVVGIDRDPAAVAAATARLAPFAGRATVVRDRFDHLDRHVGGRAVVGVLLDLGVSSHQFDEASRGFSYRADAPLDMRMDPADDRTAADILNEYDEDRLAALFVEHGETRFGRRIARAVVAARPLLTTMQLVDVVRDAIPAPARRRGGHPAKRVFQALRVEVNDELGVLPRALGAALRVLTVSGVCAVLAYHSGEDRIVKERFTLATTGGCTCPPGLPCVCGAVHEFERLRRVPRKPSAAEVAANPRAESARLRAVRRIAAPAEAEEEEDRS